jgi:hypothetical protein
MKNKYITTHEELLKLHGKKVTCKIWGDFIDDARISVDDGIVYVCQNIKMGIYCNNKLGYKYSWYISFKSSKYEDCNNECTEIQPVNIMPTLIEWADATIKERGMEYGEFTPRDTFKLISEYIEKYLK